MRELKPLPEDSQKHMEEGQKIYKAKGMSRSAVAVNGAATKMQFKRIAKESGIYEWERYIDAASTPAWENIGVDWIKSSVDPDRH